MTIVEALCIVQCGWTTEQEHELLSKAEDKLHEESKFLHLKYQKDKAEQLLDKYTDNLKNQENK